MSQVIKKRNIVIASVLKPVDDTRMFEKMAQSLVETGRYEIHILGYPCRQIPNYPGVHFHPSMAFKRLSPYRLLIPFLSFVKAIQLEPSIVIITTHELLFFAWILKFVTGSKTVYDVRENYMRNILFLPTFSIFIRPLLAGYVRIKEVMNVPFISLFVLSDYGYKDEMIFMKKKSIVVENKVKKNSVRARRVNPTGRDIKLLFSGTLAESTGVFTAIELARKLHAVDQSIVLEIIGYCSKREVLTRIRKVIGPLPFIRLTGGDQLVPHDHIMQAISRAHFGIISYPPNPSTRNTMPTKLFEYIGSFLPILLINHPYWVNQCRRYNAAIPFDANEINAVDLLQKMRTGRFYNQQPSADIYWENEAVKLTKAISNI
ncbi:MAG TPA: hypothetical protein VFW11_05205 [Cyclobacteriaceae bacterium]|nr:hypothetical protein [Cyclobacteriaceae bacterium]